MMLSVSHTHTNTHKHKHTHKHTHTNTHTHTRAKVMGLFCPFTSQKVTYIKDGQNKIAFSIVFDPPWVTSTPFPSSLKSNLSSRSSGEMPKELRRHKSSLSELVFLPHR